MPEFVILGWTRWRFLAAAKSWGALTADRVDSKLLRFLVRVYKSRKLNRICKPPFIGIWDRIYFDTSKISPDDEVYFIVYEGFAFSYSRNYLEHLRKKYRKCKIILFYLNSAVGPGSYLEDNWRPVKDCYDAGMTINRADAERLGMLFCDFWPHLLPDKTPQPENSCDVFFAGADKGRLDTILAVYERLADAGLKLDFWITGVPADRQKHADAIHYTDAITIDWLNYDEILQRDANAKCILEIDPFGQNYATLRTYEAVRYRKKLLTTNQEAPGRWFYNAKTVQVFSEASEIDTDFITRPLSPEDEHEAFDGIDVGDFGRFADWVIRNVP